MGEHCETFANARHNVAFRNKSRALKSRSAVDSRLVWLNGETNAADRALEFSRNCLPNPLLCVLREVSIYLSFGNTTLTLPTRFGIDGL